MLLLVPSLWTFRQRHSGRKLWHNSAPQVLHICFARHAIKVQHSPTAPMRCAGLTRTPYIHSSGASSCLTLYFDRSQSVRATLQFLDYSFTVKQACNILQNACKKSWIFYSCWTYFSKAIYIFRKHRLLQFNIMNWELIRTNLLCFWLLPLYHFGIHLNHIQAPGKTKITHWLKSFPKKHKTTSHV